MDTSAETYYTDFQVQRGWRDIEPLYNLIVGRGFIAGSYAAYMAAPGGSHVITPGDIDVFCVSEEAYQSLYEEPVFKLINMTPIAATVRAPLLTDMDIQLIRPHPSWTDFPGDIVQSFDLTISRAVLVNPGCVIGDLALGSREGKILRVNNPLKVLQRIEKYARRGVSFNAWELAKVLRAFEAMPASDRWTMLDQVQNPDAPERVFSGDPYGDWYDEDDWWAGE